VRKPDAVFFERLVDLVGVAAGEVAYVGDRVDNDVVPSARAGLVAVHLRRGPWGRLQPTPEDVIAIDTLAELPGALASS
jgi:FMN phosphatase YigB (HAD superfamily)